MKQYNKIQGLAFTVVLIISMFIVKQVFADEACNPETCYESGSGAVVTQCKTDPGYPPTYCLNDGTTTGTWSCPTGGGQGSCSGLAVGVNGCLNNSVTSTGTCTTCSEGAAYVSQCDFNGDTCGPTGYEGTCSGCTTSYSCGAPQDGYRSCCSTSNPTPTPTPTPPPNCGNGVCGSGENNCNCAPDCPGVCNPTSPSCSVSVTPATVDLYTDSNPFDITANVSNIQNGSVTQVEFTKSNSNVNLNPTFTGPSAPYQSTITPVSAGTTTLSANVYMTGSTSPICSTNATVNITANTGTGVDEAPDCDSFTVSDDSVAQGETVQITAQISDEGANLIEDSGFESGGMTYWSLYNELSEWYTISNILYPAVGAEGAYYAKMTMQSGATGPWAVSNWAETGQNLTNQNYTLKVKAKSHVSNTTVGNIYLQREPFGGTDWTNHATANITASLVPGSFNEFTGSGAWADRGHGAGDTTRLRAVLSPSASQPIYYDSIRAYKTSDAGINTSTLHFYYIPVGADHCVGANWEEITPYVFVPSNYYYVDWDTSTIAPGNYDVAITVEDIQGNGATGNPVGNCGLGFTHRPACNSQIEINSCLISCTEDCGTGTTWAETPGQPTNFQVNGATSGNLDLTASANLTFSWDAAPINLPADIDQYEVRIWDYDQSTTPPATCNASTSCVAYTVSGTTLSTTRVASATHTNHVRTAVRAINNSCSPTTYGSWSTVRAFNLVAQVSGNIYDLTTGPNGSNNCVGTGPLLDVTAGAPSIVAGGSTATPDSDYILFNVPYAPSSAWAPDYGFNVTLSFGNPDPENSFFCNCPTNCIQTDTASPATAQNYFVSAVNLAHGPWWQAREGNIYGTQGFTSEVPDISGEYLISSNIDDDSKSAGVPLSGGTINAAGFYTEFDGVNQPRSNDTTHPNLVVEDYDYLVSSIDLSNNSLKINNATVNGFTNGDLGGAGVTYDDAQVYWREGSLTIDLQNNKTIAAGTKKIIFVRDNVTITGNAGSANQHRVTVADGGYLAIIAGGDITFNQVHGNTCTYPSCTTTNTNIDGVYIASDDLIIADDNDANTADKMFIGEGTFVGWGGIDLQRTFDNNANQFDRALNNDYPTELFRFRPDFVESTPTILRKPTLVWQEVN